MLFWFVGTWFVTVTLTIAAASMYWSIDALPWRGFATAISMALVGIVMMVLYKTLVDHFDAAMLAIILYSVSMAQALIQLLIAAKIRSKKRKAIMNNA